MNISDEKSIFFIIIILWTLQTDYYMHYGC